MKGRYKLDSERKNGIKIYVKNDYLMKIEEIIKEKKISRSEFFHDLLLEYFKSSK